MRSLRSWHLARAVLLVLPATAQAEETTLVTRELPVAGGRSLAAAQSPERFNLVGLHWQGPGRVAFRTRTPAGRWSPWRGCGPEAEDAARPTAPPSALAVPRGGSATRTGPAPSDRLQYRLRGRVTRLRAHYVWSPADGVRAARARVTPRRVGPAILPRTSWRASESIRRAAPRYSPSSLRFAVVHHSAGSNSVHEGAVGGDRPRDPGLPRTRKRLGRHRLQLPRRQVRPGLRRPFRRCRAQRRSARTRRGSTPARSASRCSATTRSTA